MRLALACLLVLTGCGRLTGVSAARREVVSDGLQALRFPFGPEEASGRLQGRFATTRCDRLPTGELRCGGCVHGRCFQLLEDQGESRVVTPPQFGEADLRLIWAALDAQSLAELSTRFQDRVQDKLIEQEATFQPRWGLTAGVLAGVSTDRSAVGLGARAGVRRWFDVHLVGHAAFEYRYKGDHELSLRFGVEVARWSEGRLWAALGAPPASVSLFIGPLIRVPAFRGGLRTGAGVHLTDLRSAPLFFEIAAETFFAGQNSTVAAVFTLGIGL